MRWRTWSARQQSARKMSEEAKITGGCFCGNIRYAVTAGRYRVADCHCTMCRRTSGAPFVTWVIVPRAGFEYTQGTPRVLRSSAHGTREFCAGCGTPLVFFETDRPGEFDVTTGSLDHPEQFPPTKEVNEDTKLPWL